MFYRSTSFLGALALVASSFTTISTGCMADKDEIKGVVDDSPPPAGNPNAAGPGKADESGRTIAIDLQSPHPYANDMNETYRVPLAGVLPSCANRVRVHFSVLRTEANYDFLHVEGALGGAIQRYDGDNDDTWSQWIMVDPADPDVAVHLDTDYSITRHGFEIDAFEWDGGVICPAVGYLPCAAGSVDINSPHGVCECPEEPTCVAIADLEFRYNLFRGFDNSGVKLSGTNAYTTKPGPADGLVDTLVGYVNEPDVAKVVQAAANRALFDAPGYAEYGEWNEFYSLRAGDIEVSFTAPQGEHTPEVAAAIAALHAAFECGWDDRITCAENFACSTTNHQCMPEESCICTQQYDPVCAVNGRTYSNACFAGCDNAPVSHPGECGIAGDICGTILGRVCQPDFKCKYGDSGFETPYPDEGGTCVDSFACDEPHHCSELIHIAVPGVWTCTDHRCNWPTGLEWQLVEGVSFATGHPYANDASVWEQLYLPANATEMRLVTSGFALEANYDFLEVWSYANGSWQRAARYTGSDAPDGDVFAGRYHYLHFVSDYSVAENGFELTAQFKN